MPVEVVHWNPIVPRGPTWIPQTFRRLAGARTNNFGDLLGPLLVHAILEKRQLSDTGSHRLLTIGSILHLAGDGDVVWGTGHNPHVTGANHHFRSLDVRAVRGPLTRDFLLERGIEAPEVYGDPALLLPKFVTQLQSWSRDKFHDVTCVQNLNDADNYPMEGTLDPRLGLWKTLRTIVQSELVVGSSLHAIVVAESVGIPARLVRSKVEPQFKYNDYYLGTGRHNVMTASSYREAVEMGGAPPPVWHAEALLAAFPDDLFVLKH